MNLPVLIFSYLKRLDLFAQVQQCCQVFQVYLNTFLEVPLWKVTFQRLLFDLEDR